MPSPFLRRRASASSAPAVGAVLALGLAAALGSAPSGTTVRAPLPAATLTDAPELRLPSPHATADAPTDSNSPAVWSLVDGAPVLHVFTSIDGHPSRTTGESLSSLRPSRPVEWEGAAPPGGVWLEAIVPAEDDVWYGYYHNEVAPADCPDSGLVEPRIGAARSTDRGRTWEDLGIVLAAPPGTATCGSRNKYFVGGLGDCSAVLDRDGHYVYLFFSQYLPATGEQGVVVARMPWADRDAPAGALSAWQQAAWVPVPAPASYAPADGDVEAPPPPVASPLFVTTDSWHDGTTANAFWGPSVHWNTHLQQYVMLLNRARTVAFDQEGIYTSLSARLDNPGTWSVPRRLMSGGRWYPQVMGLEPGSGTDREAGRLARFYMSGRSHHVIDFSR